MKAMASELLLLSLTMIIKSTNLKNNTLNTLIAGIVVTTLVALFAVTENSSYAHSQRGEIASASAHVSVTVVTPLGMDTKKNFTLNEVTQGSKPQVIQPTDQGATQFYATGEKDHLITLSFDSQVSLNDGAGNQIGFNHIRSNVGDGSSGNSTKLNAAGVKGFQLGGSRAAFSKNQVVGMYLGFLKATVVYQ